LFDYDEKRNHPDEKKTSGLSGWLHFGKISEYEIVKAALDHQPKDWDLDSITPNGGKNAGFFNGDPNIESFLDEVITWREVGFHYAHHRPDYDQFESLPDWVQKTMDEHVTDERDFVYTLEEFEQSKTHDDLWNAAQTQLREDGIIHNYLRMLWGKKIIEWTPDYRTALDYLIELNNKYAIDGRDPNSYSGIFWCLGRFDRAWQERNVFGKLRYMTSDSTRKKVRLKQYLNKYGSQKSIIDS
jgi:deoxyribodipyrimidine photo-lyase